MAEVEEKPEGDGGGKGPKTKQASVVLQKVNLSQLRNFLQAVEFGSYRVDVTSLKIVNDEKLRGYMRADINVAASYFASEEAAGGG